MDASEFDAALTKATSPEERLAWFGALLSAAVQGHVEIVGGSAIEIYLSSDSYVSEDVDLVGDRAAISEVLRSWGFREVSGRSQRIYWFKEAIGLVDLVGAVARSGLPARRMSTPLGPLALSAVEPLIVRRLVRAKREASDAMFRQAVALARLGGIDWEYLEVEARYEEIGPLLRRLRNRIGPLKGRRKRAVNGRGATRPRR